MNRRGRAANDLDLDRHHASTFSLAFARDRVTLLFGNPLKEDKDAVTIRVSDRIILNPIVARRLAHTLNTFIRDYESRFGKISADSGVEPTSSLPLGKMSSEEAAEGAGVLFRLVSALGSNAGYERSFKVSEAGLQDNRFLLGIAKRTLGSRAEERLVETCSLMGMPAEFLDVFRHRLIQANHIHFGFEQGEDALVYKVYLEFWEEINRGIAKGNDHPEPSLLHLGLKWNALDPADRSITRYLWHPWLSTEQIHRHIDDILDQQTDRGIRQTAHDLVALALTRIPYRDILYLEVTEDGNQRRSFDINVYRAHLRVAEIYPMLSALCRRYALAYDVFHGLYNRIKRTRFGHLAAGVNRDGKDFFTVYYGVEEMTAHDMRAAPAEDAPTFPDRYASPPRNKRTIAIEKTHDKAAQLVLCVNGISRDPAFERSFKFSHDSLLTGRFLLGIKRDAAKIDQDDRILGVCKRIGMPRDYLEQFTVKLHEASNVLFGFERSERDCVYKAYLEFTGRLAAALEEKRALESVVIYDGFKWSLSDDSRKVTTEYRAYGPLSAVEMAERVSASFSGIVNPTPLRIADDFLDLAGTRTRPGQLLYFEATEENNPRKSFDINLYRARLHLYEVYPLLVDMARHYHIHPVEFEELYEGVKTHTVGHLSGGIDREAKDFLTLYFGTKERAGGGLEETHDAVTQVPGSLSEITHNSPPVR